MVRFNPPPGWPSPPEGWRPAPNWKPDPKWPQPPAGWQLWVDEDASHRLSHEGKPAPSPGVLARPPFADRMRGKWGWAAAALVCLLGLIAGGSADALIFGGLTALILGVVAIIREPRRQGSGSARAPWPHSSQEEPASSLEGLPRRVRRRRSGTHQYRWRRPTRPNHRQHLNRHRPQQSRRVASQRSPSAATRPSSTSRSPLAESRRTDLEFACSRRCVSEAFLRTPKATELGSAGIRGRFEQAQRRSTRAPPHSTQKEVLTGRHV
jgi:hypothetical protein